MEVRGQLVGVRFLPRHGFQGLNPLPTETSHPNMGHSKFIFCIPQLLKKIGHPCHCNKICNRIESKIKKEMMLQINNCASIYLKVIHFISLSRFLGIAPFAAVPLWKSASLSSSGGTSLLRETMRVSEILSEQNLSQIAKRNACAT